VIWNRLRHRMRADAEKGSAAIEFAIVAPVFFAILMGIFEAGVIFFSQSLLQNAVNDMGRMVRTGQTCYASNAAGQCTAGMSRADFITNICNSAGVLLVNCAANLKLDVEVPAGGFTALAAPLIPGAPRPVFNDALNGYNIGNACDVVVVRAFYEWPLWTPGLSTFMANMSVSGGGAGHLLAAASAFRNEPYTTAVAGCLCTMPSAGSFAIAAAWLPWSSD
jgi:Flp pilus assembly protein TadG